MRGRKPKPQVLWNFFEELRSRETKGGLLQANGCPGCLDCAVRQGALVGTVKPGFPWNASKSLRRSRKSETAVDTDERSVPPLSTSSA